MRSGYNPARSIIDATSTGNAESDLGSRRLSAVCTRLRAT